MNDLVDLHSHTTYSDGYLSPFELIKKARQRGLRGLSITDHDTVAAIPEALEIGQNLGVEIIPGIELSCIENGRDVHLLGYFIDHTNAELLKYTAFFYNERQKRAGRIVKKLNDLNVPLRLDDVMERATSGLVGRMHVASALIDNGYSSSVKEVFDKYLGYGCPAFEAKWEFSIEQGIQLINRCNGLAVIAHPKYIPEEALLPFIDSGLDGIEVIHPCHDRNLERHYRALASEYCLLDTGGSDFHGGREQDENNFGKMGVPYSKVESMMFYKATV